jgi:hypothetical protein
VQQNAGPANTQNTFGLPNSPLDTNFSWLVHMDRNLVSPMELLQVSGFQPWQLTHAFIQKNGSTLVPWSQRVPWFDEDLASPGTTSHRLYRALEFFKTHALAAGVEGTGRIPGKVNLNTIFDQGMTGTGTVFQSVCDPRTPNASNNFAQSDVTTAWNNLQTFRSDEWATVGTAPDHPYGSIATGLDTTGTAQYPNGISLNNTLLASTGVGTPPPRILQAATLASGNPYLYDQLMSKIANQVTNRSHVFAVYLTVGFFRVLTDPALPVGQNTTLPVKLGGEIGARNTPPTNIRHHMFAIVDRSALTQLRIPQTFPAAQASATASNITPAGNGFVTATLPVSALQGNAPGPWQIGVGTRLLVDSGSPEIVTVTGVNSLTTPPSFTANFSNAHNGSISVAVPVETNFDPTNGSVQTITGSTAIPAAGSATVSIAGQPQLLQLIQPGVQLFLDSFPNQEVVTVSSVDLTNNTFTASFARPHLSTPYNIFIPQRNATTKSNIYGSGSYTVTVDALSDGDISSPAQAVAWKIQPGSIITLDTGANQETVQVAAVDSGNKTFTATFNKAHSTGCGVYAPQFGNPGPQPNFSARDNSAVVLYAAVID